MKTEDDFDSKYTQDSSVVSECFDGDGRLETFGKDLETLESLMNPNNAIKFITGVKSAKRRVWTAVDGDEGIWWIAGYHLVNRIYYIITKEEWTTEDEAYLMFPNND